MIERSPPLSKEVHFQYIEQVQKLIQKGMGVAEACEKLGYRDHNYRKYKKDWEVSQNSHGGTLNLIEQPQPQVRQHPNPEPAKVQEVSGGKLHAVILTGSKEELSEVLRNILQ